ncbi:hypothetical protein TrispH2_010732 [Trichoplax sp. H2]|nr:hypothetical protein TrispH2_010732 [Trichoplax sp. H2]|eukprot:RDD37351.1 hypothetical protein TrispH2_010732 [Trichoplax sp. H2]
MASSGSRSFRFAKFAFKVGIGVGAVYLTVVEGLWSNSTNNSGEVYNKVKATFLPQLNQAEKMAAEDRLSNLRDNVATEKLKEYWNSGVNSVFFGLKNSPEKINDIIKDSLK